MVHIVKIIVVYATSTMISSQLLQQWDGPRTLSVIALDTLFAANFLRAPLARLMSFYQLLDITSSAADIISLAL